MPHAAPFAGLGFIFDDAAHPPEPPRIAPCWEAVLFDERGEAFAEILDEEAWSLASALAAALPAVLLRRRTLSGVRPAQAPPPP